MNISNRWFCFMAPRRCDLTGIPFGFLLILFPKAGSGRWSPVSGWSVGTYLPFTPARRSSDDSGCLTIFSDHRYDDDWQKWPEKYRSSCDRATERFAAGRKILADYSRCDRRVDLTGSPYQLYRETLFEAA